MTVKLNVLIVSLVIITPFVGMADVRPAALFADGMVIQRETEAPVFGTADASEEVTVSASWGESAATTADASGTWRVTLKTPAAGGPYSLTIKGNNTVDIHDVLCGEVWFCSGQSNMDFVLEQLAKASPKRTTAEHQPAAHYVKKEIETATDDGLRQFTVNKGMSPFEPRTTLAGSWMDSSPKNNPSFSATAYFFGRELRKKLGVPVGLIKCAWGGTRVEPWIPAEAFLQDTEMAAYYSSNRSDLENQVASWDPKKAEADYQAALERHKEKAKGKKARRHRKPRKPSKPNGGPQFPSTLFNAMVNPVVPYAIKGAIWYQGESNAGHNIPQYEHHFRTMISAWREQWDQGDFPFYFAQLANFQQPVTEPVEFDSWALICDQQRRTLGLKHTGMAVLSDIGEAADIHPHNKIDVGKRLALWALKHDYKQKVPVCSGPLYKSHTIKGNQVIITFDSAGSGLMAGSKVGMADTQKSDEPLQHFQICGADRQWQWANVEITGTDTITVSHPDVANPTVVRYAWAQNAEAANLYNKQGLPASIFTTEAEIPAKAAKRPVAESARAPSGSEWQGKKSTFHGFDQVGFKFEGVDCKVVLPKKIADGKPWVWRARFWGHEPQFDVAMLKRGYHIVYCNVGNLFGSPEAVKRWNAFYDYLRFEHLFADKPVLEGMSRGGLIVYNWAAANPDKVKAIYADAPVMDFTSWPGGKGKGKGAGGAWKTCLNAYGLTDAEALAYKGNPLDNLAPLAQAGIPLIHVVGDADDIVPLAENTAIAEARYKKLGGVIKVIHKPDTGHHPHSLKNPQPIVDFVTQPDKGQSTLAAKEIVGDQNFVLRGDSRNSRIQFEQKKRGHVAFLGGSITEMNGYRPIVCEMLKTRFPETEFTFTNAGISSTCSDTGAFRMQRDVLSKGPLDMLFVEYTVNDDQDGDQGYHDALRGMEGVIAQARKHNPNVDIVMTMFVNENILSQAKQGRMAASVAAHSKVAEHYDVSVNNLAQELADQITAGKTDWKTYGGVHPKKHGNTMCATMIANALLKEWAKPLPANAEPRAYPVKEAIDEKSYIRGRFLPFEDATTDANWKVGVPIWKGENRGAVRARFMKSPMIYSSTAGAKLTIDFAGTAIGAYMLAGPDAGILRCTIDGKQTNEIDTLCKFSGFNYPVTIMFFNELETGDHTLELEILENRPGRMKQGGTALRVIGFTAN